MPVISNPVKRVLIVGLGSIGQRHLRIARTLLPDADIRVLRHRPGSELPEYANGSFARLEDALAFAPEFAVLASPSSHHVPVAHALASAGTHLLVEKPLAAKLAGVAELVELCRIQAVTLLTGYNLRFLDSLREYRRLLQTDAIGMLYSVRCEIGQYLPSWRPDADYRQGVSARRALGGGALLELSHEIDYLRWIFGEVEWVQATLARQSTLELDVEDTAHLTLGFASPDGSRQLIGSLNLDFIRQDTTRLCTAIGYGGSLRWDGLRGTVGIFKAGAKDWIELYRHQHDRDDSYLSEWSHALACIAGQAEPLVTGHDGLQVLKIIAAARISSETGRRTHVTTLAPH